jgi:hypothetical protein
VSFRLLWGEWPRVGTARALPLGTGSSSRASLLRFFHCALHSATAASAVLMVATAPASPVGVCERRSSLEERRDGCSSLSPMDVEVEAHADSGKQGGVSLDEGRHCRHSHGEGGVDIRRGCALCPIPRAHHALSGEALTRATQPPHLQCDVGERGGATDTAHLPSEGRDAQGRRFSSVCLQIAGASCTCTTQYG